MKRQHLIRFIVSYRIVYEDSTKIEYIEREYMTHFQAGDRVRIRKGARVSVQIGVNPGMSGIILPIREWDPRPWHEGTWDEPIYFVRIDGFSEHDIVEESALELDG